MNISEIFYTVQGEGKRLGVPSIFIRTSGCNLRCEWTNPDGSKTKCDTPYTSWQPEKNMMTIDNILKEVSKYPARADVVITGGEPFIQPDLSELCNKLPSTHNITIETNGTVFKTLAIDMVSISPKLKSSVPEGIFSDMHENNRSNRQALQTFVDEYDNYQFKFVVNTENDIKEINEIISALYINPQNVYLMPQGISTPQLQQKTQWIVELCKQYGYCFTPRIHIDIYGNKRGT